MSYDVIERSNFDGQPIALYAFQLGENYWRYSGDEVDTVRGVDSNGDPIVYEAVTISDNGITLSGDATNDDLNILMPSSQGLPQLFLGTPPSEPIYAYLRRTHHGEEDAPVIWIGEVVSVKRQDSIMSEVKCKMLTASFDRTGLRLNWGRQCPHALYDRNCRVNKNAYAVSFQIETLTNGRVGAAALGSFAAGWFSNGFFEWDLLPGIKNRRGIENHTGSGFSVLGTLDGLSAGQWVTAYPGCPRTTAACVSKFNNLANYGGYPHLPGKSPFQGDPVF